MNSKMKLPLVEYAVRVCVCVWYMKICCSQASFPILTRLCDFLDWSIIYYYHQDCGRYLQIYFGLLATHSFTNFTVFLEAPGFCKSESSGSVIEASSQNWSLFRIFIPCARDIWLTSITWEIYWDTVVCTMYLTALLDSI